MTPEVIGRDRYDMDADNTFTLAQVNSNTRHNTNTNHIHKTSNFVDENIDLIHEDTEGLSL